MGKKMGKLASFPDFGLFITLGKQKNTGFIPKKYPSGLPPPKKKGISDGL